jgi:Bax protein
VWRAPASHMSPSAVIDPDKMPEKERNASAAALFSYFVGQGYTLDNVRQENGAVPRVLLVRLPNDLPKLDSVDVRKAVFIKMLLPLILAENERILADRGQLLALRQRMAQNWPLTKRERDWLGTLARYYGTSPDELEELTRRVDAVPPSLALAQTALETGWGTSRVAQNGHALFGEMVFPNGSLAHAEVRNFTHLGAAMESYARNLNSHRAYAQFRERRAEMRRGGQTIDGPDLAGYIVHYSERKTDYIRDVRELMRINNLKPFDLARLSG